MKIQKSFLILLIGILSLGAFAQDFVPPADGNAVVYLVRTTSFGSALTFRFFHNENFVGIFKGKGCMRYELPAGKQLLWAASQNRRFLDCDLKPGGTYFISVLHSPGFGKNHVILSPVSVDDSNFEKCKEAVLKNKQIVTSEEKKAEVEKTLLEKDFMNTILKQYNEENNFENQTKKITPAMAIPISKLK